MASSYQRPHASADHGCCVTSLFTTMSPDTRNVPVPPPSTSWGPTLLRATMPMGLPLADSETEPDAKPFSCLTPKMPAKNVFHWGAADTVTPHAPGGGDPPGLVGENVAFGTVCPFA